MGVWQTLSFNFFLLPVIAVTCVQIVRLAWWAFRAVPSASLSSRATLVARSTRGLARAAVWLTCAGGAADLISAMILLGNTATMPMAILMQQHLAVLEVSAISLLLCALLFAASLAFDLAAARLRQLSPLPPAPSALEADGAGDTGLLVVLRGGPVVLGVIALVLVSLLLLELRPAEIAPTERDRYLFEATMDVLGRLWTRLAIILAIIGVLTWLTTLVESAMLRRRLPD